MTIPTLRLLLALAPALALLAACQGNPREQRIKAGEAVLNLGANPRTLDPSRATDVASARAILAFQRGLTTLDEKGVPQPELAESWTISPDQRVYEFKLRPAHWSDGTPITSADYVHAYINRVLNTKFGAETALYLYYIKGARAYFGNDGISSATVGVTAPAPDRLRIELEHPAPFFLQLVAHQSYFPVSLKTDLANPQWANRAESYVGSGPFLLKTWRPGDVIEAEKNPGYWNAAQVALKRITHRMIEKESTARIQLDTGEIDSTEGVPREELDQLRSQPELRFASMLSTYLVFFNTQKPPLTDVRVRRALAFAVDRGALVKNVLRAGEIPAFFFSPPQMYAEPPAPSFKDADYDGARKLLAEAGFPGGKGFPKLRYIYNTMEGHRKIAEVLQETWRRELGIEISVENQEFQVLIDNRRNRNFDLARGGWVADFSDPINFLEIFDSKSENNDSHFVDSQYDALLAGARAEPDPARRIALLKSADQYLIDQMAMIPIYYYTNPYLVTPRLKHFVLGPTGMYDPARLAWGE